MNTVDALKKLYKTLAGKDYAGDPNPTDAEMIDAIAKDAQSGGSGSGLVITGRIASGSDPTISVDPIAPNLTLNELASSTLVIAIQDKPGMVYPYIGGILMGDKYIADVSLPTGVKLQLQYYPETGEVRVTMQVDPI